MRVLLTSHGSTGDIYPVIGLGRALREAGHEVNFATAPLYRAEIERAGLGFRHLPPDWEQEIFTECMRELDRQPHPIMLLRQIFRSGLSFMPELIEELEKHIAEHDILIGSYVFPQYRELCERQKKPFGVITFCHSVVPNFRYPPDTIWRLRGWPAPIQMAWNGFWWRICNAVVDWAINDIVKDVLAEKKLPRLNGFLRHPADLCLIAVSKKLMQPSRRIAKHFHYTGYLRWQSPENPELEEELKAFTQGERVPVLTFGSVTFDHVQDIMARFQKNWQRGKKIIIQSGWAGLSVDIARPELKVVGKVSHDQLFKHASMVIHHGGAGTSASVLHAGVPHIIVPHFGDQYFWGKEIRRLRVGRVIKQEKWPELLPKAVERIETRPRYAKRAAQLGEVLAREDGATNAVREIEKHLKSYKKL